jgi:hypothetical protein
MRSGFADRVNKLGAPRHGTGTRCIFHPVLLPMGRGRADGSNSVIAEAVSTHPDRW